MASATGIPDQAIVPEDVGEEEPLLGRRGDASQREGHPLRQNLLLGMPSIPQTVREKPLTCMQALQSSPRPESFSS